MKTTTINIRISNILKDQLEAFAYKKDQKISEATRSIIESYLNNTNDLIDNNPRNNSLKPKDDLDLLQTLGFTELIFWIYEKYINPEINETDEQLYEIIDVISKIKSHPLFPYDIIKEFNKISAELNLCIANRNNELYYFSQPDNQFSFNYELFTEFFYGIRYDDNGNRVLTIQ